MPLWRQHWREAKLWSFECSSTGGWLGLSMKNVGRKVDGWLSADKWTGIAAGLAAFVPVMERPSLKVQATWLQQKKRMIAPYTHTQLFCTHKQSQVLHVPGITGTRVKYCWRLRYRSRYRGNPWGISGWCCSCWWPLETGWSSVGGFLFKNLFYMSGQTRNFSIFVWPVSPLIWDVL